MGTTDFNPRAPCGARRAEMSVTNSAFSFQPTRPLRGATAIVFRSDRLRHYFNPRAPCGARPLPADTGRGLRDFNPRAPCGARHPQQVAAFAFDAISTHAPLAGRDCAAPTARRPPWYFNPRAPCGARPHRRGGMAGEKVISTHAPLAGRDASVIVDRKPSVLFQPTRPLRGATAKVYKSLCTFLR